MGKDWNGCWGLLLPAPLAVDDSVLLREEATSSREGGWGPGGEQSRGAGVNNKWDERVKEAPGREKGAPGVQRARY